MEYTCIDKKRVRRYITSYILKDVNTGSIVEISYDEMYKLLNDNAINVDNLGLDKSGRIVGKKIENIIGKTFGNWYIIKYIDSKHHLCKCMGCGNEFEVITAKIKNGTSTQCKNCYLNSRQEDLTNKRFGSWLVLEYAGDKKWLCECQCENKTRRCIQTNALKSGKSKSCGHDTSTFKNLVNTQVYNWKILSYEGDGYYKCECQCDNKTIRKLYGGTLRANKTKSCGCMKENNRRNKLKEVYGENTPSKVYKPREEWQIDAVSSPEKFKGFVESLDNKTVTNIANKLQVHVSYIYNYVKTHNLREYVELWDFSSSKEIELRELISNNYSGEVLYNNRSVVNGIELDIYIPEKKLAIEFNGDYWHSDIHKDTRYHQNKTLACAKQGIHLIHIFEYEWIDEDKRRIISDYILGLLISSKNIIYARNTYIKEVSIQDSNRFLNRYHIQGEYNSKYRYGCYYKDELIGVITLGQSRFNSNYTFEIHRLCWKNNTIVIGGTEKIFSYIKDKLSGSIITYVDISKFTGNSYTRLGFKPIQPNPITEPNYVWVDAKEHKVLSRYQTQKHKLLEDGLGYLGNTEEEIMTNMGYYKIYNCGNLKMEISI